MKTCTVCGEALDENEQCVECGSYTCDDVDMDSEEKDQ